MKIDFVNLSRQYKRYKKEIDNSIQKVLDSGHFILGDEVQLFEKEFAQYCEAKYCVGVASGTDALFLSLKALDIKEGDEVITVPNSFIATSLCISHVGAIPVFVDIDPKTYNIDVAKIEEKINTKTKAIIPVHLFGQPADMDAIVALAKKYNLKIIEDSCQAHGARYKGKRVGNFGDISAFSFYPSKNLGAYGDGGAIITNNSELAEKIFSLRTYGGRKRDYYLDQGFNSRLDTIQAAVLRVKLKYLDESNDARRKNTEIYNELLQGQDMITPSNIDHVQSATHLYVVRTKQRDKLVEYLSERGISTGIHYPVPIHLQPAYKDLGYSQGNCMVAETVAKEIISLPLCPEIHRQEIEYVVTNIIDFYKNI